MESETHLTSEIGDVSNDCYDNNRPIHTNKQIHTHNTDQPLKDSFSDFERPQNV